MINYKPSACTACISNVKAILECNHNICLAKFAIKQFLSSSPYNYTSYCSTCLKEQKLSNILHNNSKCKVVMWL
jgi:hypothetical protein